MKLEKQVTSLKLSKKLKELGVKQNGLWAWTLRDGKVIGIQGGEGSKDLFCLSNEEVISAFTVAELGEKLKETQPELDNPFPSYGLITKRWFFPTEDGSIEAKTEANARAKTLIYLKENKLI